MNSMGPVRWVAHGVAVAVALAVGCSSKGSDLFGQAAGGSPGAGGSSGEGGAQAAGSGGLPEQGGSAGEAQGGSGGEQDASVQDASLEEAAAGSGGGPTDCADKCQVDCMQPGAAGPECVQCVQALCEADYTAMTTASQYDDYRQCLQNCGPNQQCQGQCCYNFQYACSASTVFMGCMCGYQNPDCKPSCSSLCSGGTFGDTCVACVLQSPCGRDLYAFMISGGSADYFPCVQGCGADAECVKDCCDSWPDSCTSRNATVSCVCQ